MADNLVDRFQKIRKALKMGKISKKLYFFFDKVWNDILSCCGLKEAPYMNTTALDSYIDGWWIVNCPENFSVYQVNQAVQNFIHQLFLIESEAQVIEQEKKQALERMQKDIQVGGGQIDFDFNPLHQMPEDAASLSYR